eukprot:361432-Chlamydomonas_euryale.AAC.5
MAWPGAGAKAKIAGCRRPQAAAAAAAAVAAWRSHPTTDQPPHTAGAPRRAHAAPRCAARSGVAHSQAARSRAKLLKASHSSARTTKREAARRGGPLQTKPQHTYRNAQRRSVTRRVAPHCLERSAA